MSNPKPLSIRGRSFQSRKEAIETLGISPITLYRWMAKDGIEWGLQPFEWNGIHYESKKAAAIALDISRSQITYRIRMGYTCDADLKYIRGGYAASNTRKNKMHRKFKELGL